jgi:hypothetical protein
MQASNAHLYESISSRSTKAMAAVPASSAPAPGPPLLQVPSHLTRKSSIFQTCVKQKDVSTTAC